MKEKRKTTERRNSIEDQRQGERRQNHRRRGSRRKEYCPKCGTLLNPTGRCPVCKVKVVRIR